MRLKLSLAIVALAALSNAQVWEKRIAPGLVYREEVDRMAPRIVHILRWNLGTPVIRAGADLCSGYVFDQTPNKGRATISHAVGRTGAIAGINADFFQVPYTGDPLGLMVRSGELISVPIVQRPVLAWSDDKIQIGIPEWKGDVTLTSSLAIPIDGLNESAGIDRVTLDTEAAGWAMGKAPDIAWIVRLEPGTWAPDGSRSGEIVEVVRDLAARKVAPGMAALIATGSKSAQLNGGTVGQHIRINNHATGFDWSKVKYAIGGGPTLVRSGKIEVDWKEQRFKDSFSLNRHPRSAAGITANGDVCLVAVEGREPSVSEGATLEELAQIMLRLGCVDALNLDGGGSTCLDVHGVNLSRPSDGKERPVSNAILLFEEDLTKEAGLPRPGNSTLTIRYPANVVARSDVQLTIGTEIPNSSLLWSATGAGWIDQGGLLHPVTEGDCEVTVWSRGATGKATVHVLAPPTPGPQKGRAPSTPRGPARRSNRPS